MGIEELRQKIEVKTKEVRCFLDKNDAENAKKSMEELRGLKDSLKIAEELEEEEKRDLEFQRDNKKINETKKVDEMRAMTKAVLGQKLTEEERAVVKISDNQTVVPKQFINELEELRKGFGALKPLCDVIPVTSNSGTKPCVDLDQGDELELVLEGDDIEDDSLATTEIDYKVDKIGKLIKLTSELVDDAVIDIENMAKTVFLEKAVRSENSRILNTINSNATPLILDTDVDHKAFAKEMDKQVPAARAGLITLVNTTLYSEWKNAEDKQGRNLNLITNINGQDYFNGKPIVEFDDSLIKLTEGKTKVAYMVNMKEAVKFFDRKQVTIAKAEKFENDTKMLRILERIDVKKGSTKSIKKMEL
ncbi:phage major capsid protein [Clostridium sporogenes]|uniref:phage major capsid protein n=1 Tax=Clostridium sporogenes TaxID=1509 RepID=UPI0005EFF59B|nr:phage major capsid protein [Clostridium sporogenes]MBY7015124.1 phage major capsid protein [Clostridium sporogenes]NFD94575.1 phage major capsid protein [Clostridium sporogenes]NFE45440.1 phage major capsid protein [Clostridium sporogenes]NFF16133.1 phage major capsid protein [Clostridium sporogenes]NFF73682.1 phage major capsid protein [Clostridium sporogenes]